MILNVQNHNSTQRNQSITTSQIIANLDLMMGLGKFEITPLQGQIQTIVGDQINSNHSEIKMEIRYMIIMQEDITVL